MSQEGPAFRGAAYCVHGPRSQHASQFTDVRLQGRGVQKQPVKVQPKVPVVPGSEVEMPATPAGEADQGTWSHGAIVGARQGELATLKYAISPVREPGEEAARAPARSGIIPFCRACE
jgi:hypothetical protein